MKNLKDYVTKNDNGELVYDEAGFQAEIDRVRNQASETARENAEKKLRTSIENELRKKIEEEAKLSAEEQFQKQREKFAAEKKAYTIERVKNIYKDSGMFTEEEIELYSALITEDYEKSSENANKIVNARKAYTEQYETSFIEKMQQTQPRSKNGASNKESYAAQKAKSYAQNHNDDPIDL